AAMNALRQVHAAYLSENLRGLPGLVIPQTAPGAGHVYHQYTIRIRGQRGFPLNRDEFVDYMQRQGIETPVHYPTPVHLQPAYTKIRPWGQFPVAEQVAREVVSLPVHPSLTHDDLTWIVAAIRALYD
ncbi:DegT/DnrJ/EryC1/StrS family aminotransferase, partial [Candidatus Berkelbacteria bacterium]|nr:DegT/DnrJ/EryC1/StrS family aminotransferase [Candidatus Berkelbacteria bacterium]